MYCPKCKENFDEGSRRFCPTDGSRLVSEAAGSTPGRTGGIFANLIPKIEAISDLDENLSSAPRPVTGQTENREPVFTIRPAEPEPVFFELDDLDLDIQPMQSDIKPSATPIPVKLVEDRPVTRKVQPFEIPAGHVDLTNSGRDRGFAAEFDMNNPEHLVDRTVKGRYHVTEFLGGDEMGLAYLADDRIVTDRKVLVRILFEDDYDEIMSSILAEERVSLSHFSHPNIARLIDSGEFANGANFLVTEYVDALSVNDILTIHGQFAPQRAARVIRQAASALNEAHQEGIIHRDIRPENLIIDACGEIEQIKVVNFGASNGDPNEHNIVYKAPEVLEGKIATVASDIYSLGVVAYEMLTGQLPYEGSTARELVRFQSAGLPVMPTDLRPDLPRSVNEVLDRALAFNGSDRFPKARDFGDALFSSLSEPSRPIAALEPIRPQAEPETANTANDQAPPVENTIRKGNFVSLEPISAKHAEESPNSNAPAEPSWRNRSPEPPETGSSWKKVVAAVATLVILSMVGVVWYFWIYNAPLVEDRAVQPVQTADNATQAPAPAPETEMPPLPRNVSQPPNSIFYQNTKENLKGDLLRNFVGFTLFYPKDWKINGPQNGATANSRGKFLDISRVTPEGKLKEQMLISYYSSKGTFNDDSEKFPVMVKETNDTLKKILPGYQMVSEGEIKLNGNWRAYEVKFQGGGTSENGEKLIVWGRRLFIPAARLGVRNGFEITMLATSLAENVRSVDDIGVKGELAAILDTFEPSQNF
ncbi:MAG: protein kinase [Acidobacteria bacterium]|nr:protein kinase [Acidobacteriota bacterium]